jgi:DEAD/DEAH box helicase domain-containing protein
VEEEQSARPAGNGKVAVGEVTVTAQVTGFRRQRLLSEMLLETVPLDLPEQSYRTEALWLTLPAEIAEPGGLHALEHALCAVAPLLAMCDRADIGGSFSSEHPDLAAPAVFLYDAHAGGVGVSAALYDMLDQLLRETLDLIAGCGCVEGCPGCIHSPHCGSNNAPLDRPGALRLLESLLGVAPSTPR